MSRYQAKFIKQNFIKQNLCREHTSCWTDGHNVRIDYRFAAANPETYPKYAAELGAPAPDVILAPGGSLAAMLQATRTVPIVFAFSVDPVGSGLVEHLSRPGGNGTVFCCSNTI